MTIQYYITIKSIAASMFHNICRGRRAIPPPDITPNSTFRRHFCLAQKFVYSSRTGRYSAASGKLGKNHRNHPIAMTGKIKLPRCFRLGRPPVRYLNNDTAWSNSETFKKWFNSVFLPRIRSRTSDKVALLVDNAGSHSNLEVTVIPLPPNVNSVHQPMDMVVILTWKQTYRRLLVQELVQDIEYRAERRAFYEGHT